MVADQQTTNLTIKASISLKSDVNLLKCGCDINARELNKHGLIWTILMQHNTATLAKR